MIDDFLTIGQFAERLQISRSTAYTWIAQGRLEVGKHLMRINGVCRIIWNADLHQHLFSQSTTTEQRPRLIRKGTGGRNKFAFDSDSLDC